MKIWVFNTSPRVFGIGGGRLSCKRDVSSLKQTNDYSMWLSWSWDSPPLCFLVSVGYDLKQYYCYTEILELYIMLSYIGLLSSSIQIRNPANKWRPSKIGLTLGQRQRRWSIINPALDRRLVFSGKIQSSEQKRLTRIWIVIGDDPPMAQHCANIGLIYRGFSIDYLILYLVLVQNIQLSQLRHEILVLPSKHEHSLKAASMSRVCWDRSV